MQYLFQKDGRQTMLTPLKLYGEINDLFKNQDDNKEEIDNEIFVDLSNMEWVNLTSLVELILFIENWLTSGKSVTVALPNLNLLSKEEKTIKEKNIPTIILENRSKRRKNVLEWLSKLGIVEALSFNHIELKDKKRFKLIEKYDHGLYIECQTNNSEYIFNEIIINKTKARRILEKLPFLKWVNIKEIVSENGIISSLFIDELMKCIVKSGFNKDVAIDIGQRIIVEFIKNTRDHSSKDYFLFGIAKNQFFNYEKELTDEKQMSIKEFRHPCFLGKNFLFDEFTYYHKITNEELMIEIAFGDNGVGIPCSLRKNEEYFYKTDDDLLQLSFDRWSSKIPYKTREDYINRGTRGLYHVRRIITKYDGFVAIRHKDNFFGFNDLVDDKFVDKIVNNKDLPDDEFVKNFNEENNLFKYNFKIKNIEINNILPQFEGTIFTIKLLPDRVDRLSYKYYPRKQLPTSESIRIVVDIDNYQEALHNIGEESKKNNSKLFLISVKEKHFNNDIEVPQYTKNLRQFLTMLSDMRHPNVHIVYGLPPKLGDSWIFDEIENFVNTYIKEINDSNSPIFEKFTDRDFVSVYDPVLVINSKGEMFWIGTNNEERNEFLKKLTREDNGIDIRSIEKKPDLITFVNDDKGLFTKVDDKIFLKINKNAPIDYLENIIKVEIKEIDNEFKKEKKAILTPNLKYTKGWFPIGVISRHLNETILALYALWIENRKLILQKHFPKYFDKVQLNNNDSNLYELESDLDNKQKYLLQNKIKVLVESETDKELGERFLQLLDISESHNNLKVLSDEFDYKKPRRISLFESSDKVIIITSLVSTGETIKNMIKSVLRSNASPLAVLSLIDISGNKRDEIPVWGNNVFYFSKFPDNSLVVEDKSLIKNVKYKNPDGSVDKTEWKQDTYKISKLLRKMIVDSKSLHFNHIGKPNARHFTFYFNAHRFLDFKNHNLFFINKYWKIKFPNEEKIKDNYESFQDFIWKLFLQSPLLEHIDFWKCKENSIIWYPDKDYRKGYQGQGEDLAKIIQKGLKNDYSIHIEKQPIPREGTTKTNINPNSNIIITDWGSLTLETIEKLIYKAHTKIVKEVEKFDDGEKIKEFITKDNIIEHNILVCIFINQLPQSKYDYIKKIFELRTKQRILLKEVNNENTKKRDLFSDVQIKDKEIEIISKLNVEFVNDFPLTCYESDYECNVCAMIKDLSDYSFPEIELTDVFKTRKDMLRIKSRETTLNPPFDFYSQEKEEILLDSDFIIKMFEFKHLLMLSESSTFYRLQVKNKLLNIVQKIINIDLNERTQSNSDFKWEKIYRESSELLKNNKFEKHEIENIKIDEALSEIGSIIYLLSIETSWVQKPPISFPDLRSLIAIIAKTIIFNSKLKILQEYDSNGNVRKNKDVLRIKYAAITVLRIVDKKEFLQNITTILQTTHFDDIGSNSILENVLFHINTFISKDYHAKHDDLAELIKVLSEFDTMFLNHTNYQQLREALWYLKLSAQNLKIRGIFRYYNYSEIVKTCLQSYKETFEHYGHSELLTRFGKLLFPFELNESELDENKTKIDSLNNNWNYVSDTINNLYILTLRSIPKILASEWVIRHNMFYLNKLNINQSIGYADDFSNLIKKIHDDRRILMDKNFMNIYKNQLELISDYFIISSNSNEENKDAKVFIFLNSIKSDFFTSLKTGENYLSEKYNDTKTRSEIVKLKNNIEQPPMLFYPQEELNFLVYQIIENCFKHRDENENVNVSISGNFEGNYYCINFICTGTKTDLKDISELGQPKFQKSGLVKIKNALESFESEMNIEKILNGYKFLFKIQYL